MKKVFKVADIHKLLKQVNQGEISYSRMVEIMNETINETNKGWMQEMGEEIVKLQSENSELKERIKKEN
ncbi:MAG TPA: hypothetical protein DCL81_15060 [Algoriphagus sp.]|jgi:hypothetical protein|uniref:hypothetical protein n=1 Tax=Algoriphagus sp. TaxID=1872435 RepID=UPI000C6B700C|nr:hypothetical protein [Algoriphagus sp.]MAL13350.1 hypothetical protein [Algoriphagus sp.]MAN85582.1 hypothetical protein [Algoriphagus sp.]HAD52116.1 hypothetical protein [Algoriphagus sp.]HAH37772.1 hypothetical protein [Algoriphagus sp.]HAS58484.1 hypothetical protein [Algoriphagus sp.]|tara:strand:- start:1448 stop:1654 length:207 start_codon:yes stop_codon:yes gene_type:complete